MGTRGRCSSRSNADGRHKLVTMVKKRRCIVCRFEFKKTKCGRQAPKLAKYEFVHLREESAAISGIAGARRDLHDFDITRQY